MPGLERPNQDAASAVRESLLAAHLLSELKGFHVHRTCFLYGRVYRAFLEVVGARQTLVALHPACVLTLSLHLLILCICPEANATSASK